jgi:periplasmic divalent cation tolerance protein
MAVLIQVQTTFATHDDAITIGRRVVEERLAACAQVLPGLVSLYMWEGMLRHDEETLLVLKTTAERWPDLRDKLAELHPYDTPEIIAFPIENVSFDYLVWVRESVK